MKFEIHHQESCFKLTFLAECNFLHLHFERLSDNKIKTWLLRVSNVSLACSEDDYHYKNTQWSTMLVLTKQRIVQDFR